MSQALSRFCRRVTLTGLGLVVWGLGQIAHAANPSLAETVFSTGAYKNNAEMSRVLRIPHAEALEVTVSGETEDKFDVVRVYFDDKSAHKDFSGNIDLKYRQAERVFIVPGDTIQVTFHSDPRTVRDGATVKIALASTTTAAFNAIRQGINSAVLSISTNGANLARQEISKNIETFQALHKNLQTNKNVDQLVPQITEGLKSISQSYALIGDMSDEIDASTANEFKTLTALMQQTQENRNQLKERKANLEKEYMQLNQKLKSEGNSLSYQKLEITLKGKEQIINSLQVQIDVWDEFNQTQNNLFAALQAHAEKIGLLLHILKVNSKVYREAANALQLKHDLRLALDALSNLSELNAVLGDIEKNWQEVSKLKNQIDTVNF